MVVEHGLFWTVFSAVLGALLMAGMFFMCLSAYSRREKDGAELDAPIYLYGGMLLPIMMFAAGYYLAMGGT